MILKDLGTIFENKMYVLHFEKNSFAFALTVQKPKFCEKDIICPKKIPSAIRCPF